MKHLLTLLYLLMASTSLFAQFCEGNLGENIFTEGDFGAGTANVLLTDPGIAPGYIYNTNPPPDDGEYVITNNIAMWAVTWDWLKTQDNSGDPNGYMLVVNASIDPGLFYEKQIDGLCENTLYEFSADIINLHSTNINTILPNVSFLIDGVESFSTGDIPRNAIWNTYGFTFTTAPGQTSVVLALQNNAPGGQGNDLAIDNIAFRACGPQTIILPAEDVNICADGEPLDLDADIIGTEYDSPAIQWQQSFDGGITWVDIPGANDFTFMHSELISGDYYYRYILANGDANLTNEKCRVISSNKIVNVVPNLFTVADTICDGLTYTTGNSSYTVSGNYVDSLTSSVGCDSIVTLALTVIPDIGISADIEANDASCDNLSDGSIVVDNIMNGTPPLSFSIDGETAGTQTFDLEPGNYQFLITDRYGCFLEENLTISSPPPFTIDIGEDRNVSLGEMVPLQVLTDNDNVEDYFWTPMELNDCVEPCSEIELTPLDNIAVTVTASTLSGCEAQDSIFITVDKNTEIAIPSAFSPNDDGLNDFFSFNTSLAIIQEVQSFRIFNRWGQIIYDASNDSSANGWDGTSKSNPAPVGVYPYVIEVLFIDGETIVYQGAVTLIR